MFLHDTGKKIAIIGAGVAGLTAAYLLAKKHHIYLFDKNHYCGGHANTITLSKGADKGMPIDTGFIVFNKQNYPTFLKLLGLLQVNYMKSDMSFSYYNKTPYHLYSSDVPFGLFGKKRNALSFTFYKFINDILKFNMFAKRDLDQNLNLDGDLANYLSYYNFGRSFTDHYVVPMGAAIWSTSYTDTLAMPAQTFLNFWRNHGLLQVGDRPDWHTIKGGSKTYVEAITKKLPNIFLNTAATAVKRYDNGVCVTTADGNECHCDAVVIATHADQALQLLETPTAIEKELLGAWSYSKNHTVFHNNSDFLPPKKRCWASWNYQRFTADNEAPVTVSYYMNRLQNLPSKTPYVVTLNSPITIEDDYVIKDFIYEHPCFTKSSIATQEHLHKLQGVNHTYYCGSYFKYGFHEDAAASGANLGQYFGIKL